MPIFGMLFVVLFGLVFMGIKFFINIVWVMFAIFMSFVVDWMFHLVELLVFVSWRCFFIQKKMNLLYIIKSCLLYNFFIIFTK